MSETKIRTIKRRSGTKFILAEKDVDPDRVIVSMVEWRDCIYLATQKGVYRIEGDKFIRLEIIDKKE